MRQKGGRRRAAQNTLRLQKRKGLNLTSNDAVDKNNAVKLLRSYFIEKALPMDGEKVDSIC